MPTVGSILFAGIPFFSDGAVPFRAQPNNLSASRHASPAKHQPLDSLLEDVERRFAPDLYACMPDAERFPGRDNSAVARLVWGQDRPYHDLRLYDWYYPFGASRWSVFHGLATSSCVRAMLDSGGLKEAKTFTMSCLPDGPDVAGRGYTVSSPMRLLPPKPIGEDFGPEALYLVSLVDERYYFRYRPVSLAPSVSDTWATLIEAVRAALDVTLSYSAIDPAFAKPEPDSHLQCNHDDAALLLDALAYNVGRAVVRKLDGTYRLLTPPESKTLADANRRPRNTLTRLAGGDSLRSGGTPLPAGDFGRATAATMPSTVRVTFPRWVTSGGGHWYDPGGHTTWFSETFPTVHAIDVPIASGGPTVSSCQVFSGTFSVHDTAKALYATDALAAVSGGTPTNASGLTALGTAVARTHWQSLALTGLDELLPGTVNWEPEGLHDLVWTVSFLRRRASLRVMRRPWSAAVREMQHACPAVTPPAGGGAVSVNQVQLTSGAVVTSDSATLYPASGTAFVIDGGTFIQLTTVVQGGPAYYGTTYVVVSGAAPVTVTPGSSGPVLGVTTGASGGTLGGLNVTPLSGAYPYNLVTNLGPGPLTLLGGASGVDPSLALNLPSGVAQITLPAGGFATLTFVGSGASAVSTTGLFTAGRKLVTASGPVTLAGLDPLTTQVGFKLSSGQWPLYGLTGGWEGRTITLAGEGDSQGSLLITGGGASGVASGQAINTGTSSDGSALVVPLHPGGQATLTWSSRTSGWAPLLPGQGLSWRPPLSGSPGVLTVPAGVTSLTPSISGSVTVNGLAGLPAGVPFTIFSPGTNAGGLTLANLAPSASGLGQFSFSSSGSVTVLPGSVLTVLFDGQKVIDLGASMALVTSGVGGGVTSGVWARTEGTLAATGSGNLDSAAQIVTDHVAVTSGSVDGFAGVRLPAGVPAAIVVVRNPNGLNALKVYGNSGSQINTQGINNSIDVLGGNSRTFFRMDAAQWVSFAIL